MSVDDLPVAPPVAPMLATLARELPVGPALRYEPKWDGFRCLAFRAGDDVDLRSRHDRPLARYFPEVVAALRRLPADRFVADGELLVVRDGQNDFAALMSRLHPAASRVALLAERTPAAYVAFDVLAVGDTDLRGMAFDARRERLVALIDSADDTVSVTPLSDDPAVAEGWLAGLPGGTADGVVTKDADLRYLAGKRAMTKVKRERTIDCVVAGFRVYERPRSDGALVSSLLLGLYDAADPPELRHIGVVTSFPRADRRALLDRLRPLVAPIETHPWRAGFGLEGGPMGRLKGAASRWTPDASMDWIPVRPELVAEVAYDHVDRLRFRHPARLRRWRDDRDPESCLLDQLAASGAAPARPR
jgi:ATP-dependent DNA ligase